MNSRYYDISKWTALVFIPAAAALYAAVSTIWGWPNQTAILGTISAVEAFLGAILGIQSANYFASRDIIDKEYPENV